MMTLKLLDKHLQMTLHTDSSILFLSSVLFSSPTASAPLPLISRALVTLAQSAPKEEELQMVAVPLGLVSAAHLLTTATLRHLRMEHISTAQQASPWCAAS